jgi:osmotically-inducible protein OsmY
VVNDITIKPTANVANIKIEDAMKRQAKVEAKGIRVTVLNDEVSLDGKVDSRDERQADISRLVCSRRTVG